MTVSIMRLIILFILISYGYSDSTIDNVTLPTNLHNGFSEKIGNFSLELLYHTSKELDNHSNFVLAPLTVWTPMALLTEGASGNTLTQLNYVLRLSNNRTITRINFQNIAKWLEVRTNTIELEKINAMFVDEKKLPWQDFQEIAKTYYDTQMIPLDFTQNGNILADTVNQAISKFTHDKITHLVESSSFSEAEMILTSALYFKGQWTVPFNVSSTAIRPFFDSNGVRTGEVKMMYNRFNYPYANIKELQARVLEIKYGIEDRLSMLIMLPNPNVTLESMFLNFQSVPLDTVFTELRTSQEEYEDDQVDIFLPRFKIESNLVLTEIFKEKFGITDLFDSNEARLNRLSRVPLYVTKIIHKAKIEVTEEGTTASGVTAVEFANRIGVPRFEANRPFCYVIVEKVTNTIVFGGFYRQPSLY